jgi:hypothetical protein
MYVSHKRLSVSVFRVKIVALGPLKMVTENVLQKKLVKTIGAQSHVVI